VRRVGRHRARRDDLRIRRGAERLAGGAARQPLGAAEWACRLLSGADRQEAVVSRGRTHWWAGGPGRIQAESVPRSSRRQRQSIELLALERTVPLRQRPASVQPVRALRRVLPVLPEWCRRQWEQPGQLRLVPR
jgi:hypothetical protein